MEYYYENGRHDLPWRKNYSDYYVVVSEIMLQQTQVDRVISFFNAWIKNFPDWKTLANAPQSEVLKYWKGLGYNSRALRLQKIAQIVVEKYGGDIPLDYETILQLPGIGPYTAGAIKAFVFNEFLPIIETNIRRVFIHHFFTQQSNVSDKQIFETINSIGEIHNPRQWYWALMDYGSQLPKIQKYNPNIQSKHYTKQSIFKGSDREIRGKILEILLEQKNHKITPITLFKKIHISCHSRESEKQEGKRYLKILKQLEKEGFLKTEKKGIVLV